MARGLSKRELITIAERLMAKDSLSKSELLRLIDDFETNVPYPDATELIFKHRDEFKDAAEIVDFALGEEKTKKLSRDELIEVARKLMFADIKTELESAQLSRLFDANVPHPDGDSLIFHPKFEFETPEDLVDFALAYRQPKK
jgi:hypothetical protein